MNSLASFADYADALLIARKAKNVALGVITLMLLGQMTLFFIWRSSTSTSSTTSTSTANAVSVPSTTPATEPTTLPANQSAPQTPPAPSQKPRQIAHYLLGLTSFITLTAAIVALVDMALILFIQLIGRLLGTANITRSFFLMVILTVMLFPWQAFLNDANLSNVDFKIPGVLYSWTELNLNARFEGQGFWISTLRWMRFVGFPLIALGIVFVIHMNSAKALRLALGEEKPAGV